MSLRNIFKRARAPTTTQPVTRKYELLRDQTRTIRGGPTLYRIRAVRDFGRVKAGECGGFVESESNLSHDGTCWVADNAEVFDNARVLDNAIVSENAMVFGNAKVFENAHVRRTARVHHWAEVRRHEKINGGELRWPVKTRWQYFKTRCKRRWRDGFLGW